MHPAVRLVLRRPLPNFAYGTFPLLKVVFDLIAWAVLIISAAVRFSVADIRFDWGPVFRTMAVAVGLQGLGGFATGLYRGTRRYGSFEELADLARVAFCVGSVTTLVEWGFSP